MSWFQRFYLVIAGLFIALSFWIPPAQAFTSLQSCYQTPACAKMLIDAGMIGGSAVPQGVVTTASASTAIASGAPAASSIVIPAAAGAVGVAALVLPWNQDKADDLARWYRSPYEPSAGDGWVAYFQMDKGPYVSKLGNTDPSAVYTVGDRCGGNGNGLERYLNGSFQACQELPGEKTLSVEYLFIGDNPEEWPEFPPPLSPSELPNPDLFEQLFGQPQDVPFPNPQPGPDGQEGTDDDIYPPLVLPGPTISSDVNGDPLYNPSDYTMPNPLAASDPATDPGTDPATDPLVLDPPPAQSSGCDGWGYAICRLSDKFPFDIVGDLPDAPASFCPQFSFFGQGAEFCFIRDMLASLKYVAAGSLVVYGVMNL